MAKKIYELAKELGSDSALVLVEEIKKCGFTVRNHMSSLSDEDLEKFLEMRVAKAESAAPAKKAAKKKAKKKVAKKTAAKKKVTKKKVTASASVDDTQEDEAKEKKVVRKKTVIRRKKSVEEEVVETSPEVDVISGEIAAQEPAASDVAETISEEVVENIVSESGDSDKDSVGGLRVVAMPKVAEEVKKSPSSEEEKPAVKSGPKEKKRHTFTPVYIPPKKEVKKEEDSPKPKVTVSDSATADGKDDKKKIGGLAALVTGKKSVGAQNKHRQLTEQKSVEELKTYAALNTFGKPIYRQIGRKRNYIGGSKTEMTESKESKRVVGIHQAIKVKDLADKLSVKSMDFIDSAIDLSLLLHESDYLGLDLASKLAAKYKYTVEDISFNEDEIIGKQEVDAKEKEKFPSRNSIITIMGHVDHGKTTLLDYIRDAKVVASEAGGITQHIGAYLVEVNKTTLTFLDTPGHAAFASMRQRGADVTDIVILVVAADDGVMPQTKESIRFCKEAGVPVIVAVNKMDKEGVNPDKVKQELVEFGITPEEWGGDTLFVEISALKGDGVDSLLETIALQTEMLELRANPKAPLEAVVIESKVEQGRGPIATILVQTGTLKKGDSVVVGEVFGRARTLYNTTGQELKNAGPSTPVQILGLSEPPAPGDILNVVKNEREAKKIVANRITERKELESAPEKRVASLEDFFADMKVDGEKKVLKLIARSDVQGSFEAIKQAVESLGNDEVSVSVIGGGVGAITDNDVSLASSSNGYILGFNMRPVTSARRLAEDKGVDIKNYSIIYELIEDVKLALEGMLEPEFVEKYVGRAEVKDTFVIPKIGTIAGSAVIDGKILKGCSIRLLRDGKIVFDGKMSSLKRFKDDVKEVSSGYECGIGLEDYNDIKSQDIFEAYMIEEKKRTLADESNL